MTAIYISHARTPEELKAEVCSDLHRRIQNNEGYKRTVARSEAEKARIDRAINELEDMLNFWSNLTIERPIRKHGRS